MTGPYALFLLVLLLVPFANIAVYSLHPYSPTKVFLPELTSRYVERLRGHGLDPTWVRYKCGHYTLALPFHAIRAFARTLAHLRANL